ncbi:MAG: PVC-type heme-binding CxxCH protein [Planctomycetaceae bacterium]
MSIVSFRMSAVVVCLVLLTGSSFAFVPNKDAAEDASTTTATVGTAGPSGYDPPIQPASDEAVRALSSFRVPEGMQASLVAAEPLLANPVAFWIDGEGRYWVCETFRQGNAVVDNRGRDYWLLDDLAAQTVEDRLGYYRKHLGEEGLKAFSEHHDRIRVLSDKNGDGKVDEATVFADGFNDPVEGTGAGVMTVGDDVYYTNIPHLWRLRDTNGDGVADERKALLSGFGVRTAFRGHDMHGLVMGPDGRIYFSIGDRGYNVVTQEGERLARPDTGAVFRCEPDGSNLEVYAYGLRNPQELAFDDYGNLFTGDNNSDSGDRARWVYVAEGSDSGWRMYYQYQDDRGPWNRELMWLPYDTPALDSEIATGTPTGVAVKDVQPAYILPPVANLGDGPSGLTYYPGVGLSDRYDGHFFLCDFRGTPNNSGIRSFAVKPKGAGFELVDSHEFIWSILCTDADFTPDGRFIIADWVNGWNGEGKGRLYAFSDPQHVKEAAESANLLAEDFSKRTPEELIGLFSHRDQRVRQKAQFALASRPMATWTPLALDHLKQSNAITALHLVWAAGIAGRRQGIENGDQAYIFGRASSPSASRDSRVRAAAIRAAADVLSAVERDAPEEHHIRSMLNQTITSGFVDRDPVVQRESLLAMARVLNSTDGTLIQPSFAQLLNRAGDDPVLRHAIQMLLAQCHTDFLVSAKDDASIRYRVASVVALRRKHAPQVAEFLNDPAPSVVTEAARAINDVPIEEATPQLAAIASKEGLNDPTLRRVLNANFRLGTKANAEAVAKVAAIDATPVSLRVEAIEELKLWAEPPQTDRVTGMYRPIEPRDAAFVAEVARPMLDTLLSASDARVRAAAIELAAAHTIGEAEPALRKFVAETERNDAERIAALQALSAIGANDLNAILETAVADDSPKVRAEARSLWAKYDPKAAVPVLDQTIADGATVEKQAAIAALADLGNQQADAVLARWFDKFVSGQVPAEIGLDLLEAAGKREALKGRLEAYQSAASSGDKLAAWQTSLVGGNAERGRDIFMNRASVSCLRCHKVEDNRGGEVGPNLAKIGSEKDRNYLLASLVTPNTKIAEGFESVVLVTSEGKVLTGVKRAEDDKSVTIITAEGKGIVVPKDEIEERAVGQSAMPEDLLKHLSKHDVRDLVEYLTTQKGQGRANATEE